MLKIREAQQTPLDELARGHFHTRLVALLRDLIPSADAPAADLDGAIARAEREAAGFGLLGQRAIARFVVARIVCAGDDSALKSLFQTLQSRDGDPDSLMDNWLSKAAKLDPKALP